MHFAGHITSKLCNSDYPQNLNEKSNQNLNENEDQNYNSNADQASKSKNLTTIKIQTINEDIMKINKVDITQFEKLNKINSDILSEIFEVKNIKTGESMSCKCLKFDEIVDDLGFDLVNEIHSMSMMDHSSILKFIGYSPINFSNEQTPVIFTESVNYSLIEVIKSKPKNWNNTKKLINIYGIASGIKYLHDNSIHHLNLNPNRILLDSSLYPKITGYGDYIFNYNKQFPDNYNESPYLSPNYYDEKYGIKNDIYSFGLIVFLIMEGFNEFDMFYLINKSIYLNDYRPKLSMGIPSCYQNLIESCWVKNPYNRPSIDDIIYALRNDSNFISNDVDKEEFFNYVNYIDKISIKSESQIDVKPEIVFDSYPYLDSDKIDKLQNYKILDVNENFELIKLISKLSHPVLLNFYGYLPSQKLSIVTDEPKKSLFIYSWARVGNERWNLTMKLIIIYGIASVLKYLNSINKSIKELNLDNIFLDEFLFPKIHPLNISDNEYLKNDLYMYAKLVYVILTGSKLLNDITKIDDSSIPDCYKNLIKSCLTNDKFDFDQIEIQLRTDKSFITNDIDEKKYYQYIYYVENKHFSKINIFDEYNLMKPVQRIFFDPEIFFNINQFEKGKLIGEGSFSKVYIVSKKKEKDRYALKIYKKEYKFISNEERIDIYREIQINSKINHKSILKFIGYSPVNFKHKQKMCILMELANTTLKDVINKESNSLAPDGWDETKKYINIYGIAAGMKYLHSLDIIHRDLKPYNILVDQFLFPKICDFGLSKKIHNNFNSISIDSIKGFKGTPVYSAPEIFDNFAYSKASDVFSFGMILYEMVVLEEPFKGLTWIDIRNKIVHNKRPIFRYKIPVVFYTLIEKCWAQKPEDRLTFDEIVTILSDQKYIPDYVDYNDFLDYVDYIEEKLEVDPSELFKKFDSDVDQYHDIQQLNLPREILPFNVDFTQYKKLEKLGSGSYGKVYKVKNEITSETLAAKVLQKETDYLEEINKIDLIREIKGLIEVRNKHSFIKFIGFSLISFKNSHKPVILTEFAANKSLGDIIKLVRQGNAPKEWNDTLKLVNVYGIAYGMKYLHSKKILHRDLKPDNVLLDKSLYPLITDFGLSKLINDELNSKRNYYAGTLGYISPEILENYSYSEKSDVYAYALTVYEIITNEVLYKDLKSNLMLHVAKGKRPVFDSVIPNCYKRLIERCWAQNPKDRPSFAQILSLISFDPDFITDDIDIDDFEFYVKKIGGDFTLFEETIMKKFANESNRKENQPIIKEKEISIPKINETINQSTISLFNKIVEKQSNANDCFLDLNDYQKTNEVIIKGELNKVLKVIQKSSGDDYSCIVSNIDMTQFSEKEMQDIIEQTNIISQINHPAILKFIGFSPSNFKEEPKPTIITEMITRKRLFDILEFAKNNNSLVDWNNTKKFINIFGIASGMKCLHSFGIIHSNLNPKSIYLDVNMYPKMTDFGRLTQILVFNSMTYTDNFNKTSKIINSENSSKEKDVFEFGVIAYQIMMGEMPFENNLLTFNPDKKLPNCYKSLIEKCLSKNPNERPSFDDIVTTIENDIDFIMHDMNNDEISEYIKNTKCDCDEIDEI